MITGPASILRGSAHSASCADERSASYPWFPPHTPPVNTHTHTVSLLMSFSVSHTHSRIRAVRGLLVALCNTFHLLTLVLNKQYKLSVETVGVRMQSQEIT